LERAVPRIEVLDHGIQHHALCGVLADELVGSHATPSVGASQQLEQSVLLEVEVREHSLADSVERRAHPANQMRILLRNTCADQRRVEQRAEAGVVPLHAISDDLGGCVVHERTRLQTPRHGVAMWTW
jgi:hypothetical protein